MNGAHSCYTGVGADFTIQTFSLMTPCAPSDFKSALICLTGVKAVVSSCVKAVVICLTVSERLIGRISLWCSSLWSYCLSLSFIAQLTSFAEEFSASFAVRIVNALVLAQGCCRSEQVIIFATEKVQGASLASSVACFRSGSEQCRCCQRRWGRHVRRCCWLPKCVLSFVWDLGGRGAGSRLMVATRGCWRVLVQKGVK